MKTFEGKKVPVAYWLNSIEDIEDGCYQQLRNLASLPFAFHHVAAMPDTHQGYGMPIGGVLATENVIIPNAVGVDIGCGMIAQQFNLRRNDFSESQIKEVVGAIRSAVPVGFNKHKEHFGLPLSLLIKLNNSELLSKQADNASLSIGTLGGGNHFLELQYDETGNVWCMIHSGSRSLGKIACDYHNGVAKELNKDYLSSVPPEYDLAFFPVHSKEGRKYIDDMDACLEYAKWNRLSMMLEVKEIMQSVMGVGFDEGRSVHCHHNYARLENHFGKNVWVHRKGAISAQMNEAGAIPGSMGTPSYIVKGLGNIHSFTSASHGAGRKMSRTQADQTITEEEANKSIEGIVFGRWNRNRKGGLDLSECPLAYKDIEEVMKNQTDLVEPVVKLMPLAVVKG